MEFGAIRFELKATEFGHLGVFPEQAENWRWIGDQVRYSRSENGNPTHRPKILNLFAYTGGSTMAAALAGAEVVHVDSARGTVAWARRNAELSGLADAPIRWIVEDARRFISRELARGNRYDAVILDPPSYGHGPKGQNWKLERDLPGLLGESISLLSDQPLFVLLSCHTPGITDAIAGQMLEDAAKSAGHRGRISHGRTIAASNVRPQIAVRRCCAIEFPVAEFVKIPRHCARHLSSGELSYEGASYLLLRRRPVQYRIARRRDFVGPADRGACAGRRAAVRAILRTMRNSVSAKASSVSLLSVSVGSIIIASRHDRAGNRPSARGSRKSSSRLAMSIAEMPRSAFSCAARGHELVHAAVAVRHRQNVLHAAEQIIGVQHGVLATRAASPPGP